MAAARSTIGPLPFTLPNQFLYFNPHLGWRTGFGEKGIGPKHTASILHTRIRRPAHNDDRQTAETPVAPDPLDELEAIHHRHLQVRHDGADIFAALALQIRHRIPARKGVNNVEIGCLLHGDLEGRSIMLGVVHD